MEPITTSALIAIATALTAGAASWGATKQALNGTRERVERIETKLDSIHMFSTHVYTERRLSSA
jgi:hypothetical protein